MRDGSSGENELPTSSWFHFYLVSLLNSFYAFYSETLLKESVVKLLHISYYLIYVNCDLYIYNLTYLICIIKFLYFHIFSFFLFLFSLSFSFLFSFSLLRRLGIFLSKKLEMKFDT